MNKGSHANCAITTHDRRKDPNDIGNKKDSKDRGNIRGKQVERVERQSKRKKVGKTSEPFRNIFGYLRFFVYF